MQDDVSLVRDKVDIVQLIAEYSPLKQTGKNFRGVCPIHQEKTPSFFVRPERGLWYCFGCQKGGDIFTFLMEKENLSFGEALQVLAKRAGVTLTGRFERDGAQVKERLFQVLAASAEFYQQILLSPQGTAAMEYLKKRGLTDAAIENFRIGYAPESWRSTGDFLRKRGFGDEVLIQSGQAIQSDRGNQPYDRFRGRVMFPIFDHLGRIVGFSGRILTDTKEAKYLNTPETPVFKKGHILYGYHIAEPTAREKGYTILVEGNVDVVSLVDGGISNVMAPLGTGLTVDQLRLLERIQPRILLAFDADEAGKKATHRAVLEAARHGFEVKVARLTSGKDPDEAIRQDKKGLIADLRQAVSGFDYLLQEATQGVSSQGAFGRKKVVEAVFPFLQVLPDRLVKEEYVQQLASEMNTTPAALEHDFAAWTKHNQVRHTTDSFISTSQKSTSPAQLKKNRQELLEDYLIALLYNAPKTVLSNVAVATIEEEVFSQEQCLRYFVLLKEWLVSGQSDLTAVVQSLPDEDARNLDMLIIRDFGTLFDTDDEATKEIARVLRQLQELYYRKQIRQLTQQKAHQGGEEQKITQINDMIREFTERLRSLG